MFCKYNRKDIGLVHYGEFSVNDDETYLPVIILI